MRTSRRIAWLIALRTTYFMIGMAAMFTALRFLPLADAVAIAFVAPLVLMLLGCFVLNEHVGQRRLTACVVGFGGTLLVIQPSFEHVGWPALLPVVVAVVLALYMLVSRQLAKDYDPLSLQAMTGLMATAFLALVFLIDVGATPAFQLKVPDFADGLLLVRPESISITPLKESDRFPLEAVVTRTSYLGSLAEYDLDMNGMRIQAIRHDPSTEQLYAPGTRVAVKLLRENLFLLKE